MSMNALYTPPDYVPPAAVDDAATDWSGPERRSRDPIDRLSRSLNRLCVEAADPYEIVAHLEALGLDGPEAQRTYGTRDHFALATALYERTPTRLARHRSTPVIDREAMAPIAMVITFVVTFALGVLADAMVLAPALWVLVWSQIGSSLLDRSHSELGEEDRAGVLAVLMRVGIIGIAVLWALFLFDPGTGVSAVLWYGVAGLLWARRPAVALALPLLVGVALAASAWWHFPVAVVEGLTVLATMVACAPLAWRSTRRGTNAWIARRPTHLVGPAAYGVGQGLLILALLQQGPDEGNILPGAALIGLFLLASRHMLSAFKKGLGRRLWHVTGEVRFVSDARALLTLYTAVYVLPLLVAVGADHLEGPQPWFFHWYAFALFGLCLALALVSLSLGDALTPGLTFLAAGLVAVNGPFFATIVLLAAVQFVVLFARSARIERYAVHLV